ncbi:hypothetical protein [Azohydromonas australica]|uniref:hypothetical protein n=1 Tax=Azohydromonas australica TaxID=364039 RepID=UPI000419897F|nr:hypothetical protein [Azohydromonas australica]
MHDRNRRVELAARCFAEAARRLPLNAAPVPAIQEMLDVLAEQDEWRFFVDATLNLGHQASTVLLARRLVDLTRFEGRMVFVYAEPADSSWQRTATKLAMMFDHLDPSRIEETVGHYASCHDIRFVEIRKRALLCRPVAFGFSGGADDMAVNLAVQLNVRFMLRLQPYLWDDDASRKADPYYESSRIEQPDGCHMYLTDAWPQLRELLTGAPPRRALGEPLWHWYAQIQTFDPALRERSSALHRIIKAVDTSSAQPLLWPIYGLQHFRDTESRILALCMLLAQRVQTALHRPVVIVSFSPAEGISDDDAALRAQVQSAAAAHPGARMVVHRCHDAAAAGLNMPLAGALDNVQAGDVRLFLLGPVPLDLFHDALLRAGLPPVVEGQTTFGLLSTLGRPCLQLLRKNHVINNSYLCRVAGVDTSELASEAACLSAGLRDLPQAAKETPVFEDTMERLADFIVQCADPTSHWSAYFASVADHAAVPRNDKLLLALLALHEVILSESR